MINLKFQTARVHWQMGQALLPEHFYAQEHGLRQEFHQRLEMGSLPSWGVARLKWDQLQIPYGIVSLQELVLVLQSGVLIDIPGNTKPTSFNLEAAGASRVALYLHLETSYDVSVEEEGALGEETVERIIQKVTLSSMPCLETAQQSFRLAEFCKDIEGQWFVHEPYIPPLIRSGPAPFLRPVLARMRALGTSFREVLTAEIQQNYLGGESQLAAKQCLRSLFRYLNTMANVGREIYPHPYDLFCLLRDFYLDVCVYRDCQPRELLWEYRHDNLGDTFFQLLEWAEDLIQRTRSEVPYAVFEVCDGRVVCELPEGARRAKDVYWLVQRAKTAQPVDIAGTKLAAPSRCSLVHQRALRGIPYRPIPKPPFYHSFSSEVEFYALESGLEWDYAVRERQVAFFERAELDGARFFIYWRSE